MNQTHQPAKKTTQESVFGRSIFASTIALKIVGVASAQTSLDWDPTQSGGSALGGNGTWDTAATFFWDGGSQAAWPSISSEQDEAIFDGTPGTVTIDTGGVTANNLTVNVAGYTLTGDTITLDGASPTITVPDGLAQVDPGTVFNVPFAVTGTGGLTIDGVVDGDGANATFSQTNTFTSDVNLNISHINIAADDVFGNGGTLTTKTGEVWFAAVDADRTITNDVVWKGDHLHLSSATFGGVGTSAHSLTVDGDWFFDGTPSSEIDLGGNTLTINGVVSGVSGSNKALFLRGDPGVLRLNNANNTFGNPPDSRIQFNDDIIVEAMADGSYGAATNFMYVRDESGGVRHLAAFDFSRDVQFWGGGTANNKSTFGIDTNGFDFAMTGTVTRQSGKGRFAKRGAGTLTQMANFNMEDDGGLRIEGGTYTIPSGVEVTATHWDNTYGVFGGATMIVDGGDFTSGTFAAGRSAGTGTFTLASGSYTQNGELLVGFGGDGIVNINGGVAILNFFSMSSNAGVTSTMNLNGGEVRLNFFNDRNVDGIATINFNGSRVIARSNQTNFIETNTILTANVQTGGAILDTNGNDITINAPLVHDAALGGTMDGGLTKQGEGTLLLTAANTYDGGTTIEAGCLSLDNITAIPSVAAVNVDAGAGFGGIVGGGNLSDSNLQDIIDNTNWTAGAFLVIDTNGTNVTVAADITGNIGLIKKGTGELSLTGANTYTGGTIIQEGTVVGNIPSGDIEIDSFSKSGSDFTINFTWTGNVDVYRSTNLQAWGAAYATDQSSPYTDTAASGAKFFYLLVPTGQTFP